MKKALLALLASVVSLACATPALATYNDVSLDSNASFSVNGITLNVAGSSNLIESVTVDTTSLTISAPANSTFQISAPGLNQIASSVSTPNLLTDCTSALSQVTYIANGSTQTFVFTPSSTLCPSTLPSGGGSGGGGTGGGSSSGGGGSGSSSSVTSVTTTTPAPTPLASLQAELATLMAKLAVLKGTQGSTANVIASFVRDLTVGGTGADVMTLQQYLNAHGFAVATTGIGSSGHETTTFGALTKAALAKFQAANGISPASGYFGPKTRAYIAAHP